MSPTATRTFEPKLPVRAAVYQDGVVSVYEVAEDQLRQVASGGGISQLSWTGPNELAFVQQGSGVTTLRTLDARSGATADVLSVQGDLLAYGFDPTGTMVATIVAGSDGFVVVEIRYLIGERAVQRLTTMTLDGSDDALDRRFAATFSPDGARLLVLQTEVADGVEDTAPLQVRALDGRLEYWIDSDREPTHATWMPDGSLVFRSLDGVRRWRAGRDSSNPVGQLSSWYDPSASPGGTLVAYDTGRVTKNVQVRRVNVFNGRVLDIGPPGRAHPIYAAPDEVWVQIVQRCRPDCLEPFVLGPAVYAITPATGEERLLQLPTLEGLALWSEAPADAG